MLSPRRTFATATIPFADVKATAKELGVTATALRLLVSDEAHEAQIRALARAVLEGLEGEPDERGIVSVALGSKQMKIAHTALRSLFRDLGREQAEELEIVRRDLARPSRFGGRFADDEDGRAFASELVRGARAAAPKPEGPQSPIEAAGGG